MALAHCMLGNEGYNHTEYVILLFHYSNGCTKAPQCYVIFHEQWRFWYCLLGHEQKFFDPTVRLGLLRSKRVSKGDGALAWSEGLGVSQQAFSNLWVDLYPGFNSTKLLL